MTNNTLKRTPTETPVRHNNISSPLRRFATMPPPSTTGRTPLTPGLNTYATDSLRHSFNPISATNLFPDETPDTDRASSTTEPAHFSDIDEDDPSPYDDEPPSIDGDVPVIRITTDTGGVDTGDTAPAPHTDITIGNTNNPTGTNGIMPTGPSGDTHVVDSHTAASPTFGDVTENTYTLPVAFPGDTGANVSSKKRRRSGGPARAAREAAFRASKSHDTTKDTQT